MPVDLLPENTPIDRDALHEYLWRHTDRLGKVKVVQRILARDLDVTHYTISRIFREMREEGRVRKIGSDKLNVSTYLIVDPEVWRARR